MDHLFYTTIDLPIAEDSKNDNYPDMNVAGRLFSELHFAGYAQKYAVSFPDYGENGIGRKIRLFAEKKELIEQMLAEKKVSRIIRDYCLCTKPKLLSLQNIEKWEKFDRNRTCDRAVVSRVQRAIRDKDNFDYKPGCLNSNIVELSEKGYSIEEISEKLRKKVDLPFLKHESKSTGFYVNIFISKKEGNKPKIFYPNNFGLGTDLPVF